MKIQVLVAAMNQSDHSLPEKMHIDTDAIIGNQCDRNEIEEFQENGNTFRYLNFSERGVGLNRNNALMRADGDVVLFADDDMVYVDHYADIVSKAFCDHPDADVIAFNVKEKVPKRYVIRKAQKVGYLNYMRYATGRIAVRMKSVRNAGIYFNQCFGGGAEYAHGEDTLFLTDCLRKGLKFYAVPEYIAEYTEERASTWFTGYGEKYIKDQGVLYYTMSRRLYGLLCLQDAFRRRNDYKEFGSWISVYRTMIRSAREMRPGRNG